MTSHLAALAASLSTKARAQLKGGWPCRSRALHHAHIRWFNRNRLIEQHSVNYYRLTPLGLALRNHILQEQDDA